MNFCKYTNETRLSLEDASAHSGLKALAAVNGPCAGGGYELALACDEILLVDDASSAVSLPEVPLLGVLPGTGGLTRVVDKRKVRRDLADVFSSLGEGVKGKRAVQWRLVDETIPLSKFPARIAERAQALAAASPEKKGPGVALDAARRHLPRRRRRSSLRHAPDRRRPRASPSSPCARRRRTSQRRAAAMRERGSELWALRAFRELDDVLLDLRFNRPEIGVVVLQTRGDADRVLAVDAALEAEKDDWFVSEVRHHMKRVLKRLDLTARSFLAVIDKELVLRGLAAGAGPRRRPLLHAGRGGRARRSRSPR